MEIYILMIIGLIIVGTIIMSIANIATGGRFLGTNQELDDWDDEEGYLWKGSERDSKSPVRRDSHSFSDPFDNHWETSFDWKDEDNDGYDDRDDGFWNEREF